jgi:hypothetical protein
MLGIVALAGFVIVLIVTKGGSTHDFITQVFKGINKPLDFSPWAKALAERQDPVLTIAVMAVYWCFLGILVGGLVLAISAYGRRHINHPNPTSHSR